MSSAKLTVSVHVSQSAPADLHDLLHLTNKRAGSDTGRQNTKGVRADRSCLATASKDQFAPRKGRGVRVQPSERQGLVRTDTCQLLQLLRLFKQRDSEAASSVLP